MNFKEIDSATLEHQEFMIRRNNYINAMCHGILGLAVSTWLVAMLIVGGI